MTTTADTVQRENRGHSLKTDKAVLADELGEGGLAADRVEVRVALRERAEPLLQLDRAAQVLERVGRAAGEALAAGEVVEHVRELRLGLGLRAQPVGRLGVLARLV